MTDRQINLAIAEVCGIVDADQWGPVYKTPSGWVRDCPNYANDLNAIHEAENVLLKNNALLWHKYASHLDENYINQPYTVGATATQRAEALLRTIGKWEEVQP